MLRGQGYERQDVGPDRDVDGAAGSRGRAEIKPAGHAQAKALGIFFFLCCIARWGYDVGKSPGGLTATAMQAVDKSRANIHGEPLLSERVASEDGGFDDIVGRPVLQQSGRRAGFPANGKGENGTQNANDGQGAGTNSTSNAVEGVGNTLGMTGIHDMPTEKGDPKDREVNGSESTSCQTYPNFGGSSEITRRDFGCAARPDCQIYDLQNVAVEGNTLHVYAPGAGTIEMLRRWGGRLPTLYYEWGGVQKSGSPVVIHEESLDESMCPSRTTGVSFFSVPHFQENAFHLHNDNFMPISSNILSTPCLCDGAQLSSCKQYDKTYVRTPPLKQKHGHTNPEFLDVFGTLFDHTLTLKKGAHGTDLAPAEAKGKLHCFDHMVWGGVKPYYLDCQSDRSSTTWAWAHHALQYLGLPSVAPPSTVPLVPPPPPSGAEPRVLFLHRNAIQTGKDSTNRFMRDMGPLREAWAAEGMHMDDWRFKDSDSLKTMIGALSGYDIYLGVHGAQLTNVLYGNQGLVLVEVTTDGWDKEIFHKIAQARRGGYIKLRTFPSSHYQVNRDMAVKAVRCALALWRRDDNRLKVCGDAAPNPGPAQSYQKKPQNCKEGLAYFYEVGQS